MCASVSDSGVDGCAELIRSLYFVDKDDNENDIVALTHLAGASSAVEDLGVVVHVLPRPFLLRARMNAGKLCREAATAIICR